MSKRTPARWTWASWSPRSIRWASGCWACSSPSGRRSRSRWTSTAGPVTACRRPSSSGPNWSRCCRPKASARPPLVTSCGPRPRSWKFGLPAQSELWSAYLDGQPVAPQRDGDRLLLDLPASIQNAIRDLQVIYETRRDFGGPAESSGQRGPDAVAPQRPRRSSGRSAHGRRDVETSAARRASPGAVQRHGVYAAVAASAFAAVECAGRAVRVGRRRPLAVASSAGKRQRPDA